MTDEAARAARRRERWRRASRRYRQRHLEAVRERDNRRPRRGPSPTWSPSSPESYDAWAARRRRRRETRRAAERRWPYRYRYRPDRERPMSARQSRALAALLRTPGFGIFGRRRPTTTGAPPDVDAALADLPDVDVEATLVDLDAALDDLTEGDGSGC